MTVVLIVDDEPDIRALLRIVLERAGYDVLEASNGADALTLCQDREPDLILTDLLMPQMSGTDFVKALLDGGITSKVIAMSGGSLGSDPSSEISKATALGVSGILVKPFNPADVLEICQDVVSRA